MMIIRILRVHRIYIEPYGKCRRLHYSYLVCMAFHTMDTPGLGMEMGASEMDKHQSRLAIIASTNTNTTRFVFKDQANVTPFSMSTSSTLFTLTGSHILLVPTK